MRKKSFQTITALVLLLSFTVSGFTYSEATKNRLSSVHPLLRSNYFEVASEMKKFYPSLTFEIGWKGGYRTCQEQNRLFAQGRSLPGPRVTNARCGQSLHNFLVATDFVVYRNGKLIENIWNNQTFLNKFANIIRGNNLVWGGDFRSFPDIGHAQLRYSLPFLQSICGKDGCGKSEFPKIFALGGKPQTLKPLKGTKNVDYDKKPQSPKTLTKNSPVILPDGGQFVFANLPGQVCRLKGGIFYCKSA